MRLHAVSSRDYWHCGCCLGVLVLLHSSSLAQGAAPQPSPAVAGVFGTSAAPGEADPGVLSQPAAGPAAVKSNPPLSQQTLKSMGAAGPASNNSSNAPLSQPAAGPVSQQAGGPASAESGKNSTLAPGPELAFVTGEGDFAGLNPDMPTFKEEDYVGAQAERLRYPDASDFTYNFPAGEGVLTEDVGGRSYQIDVDNKPALVRSVGMSQSYFRLVPCGLNQPHMHPRSSKVVHVLAGTVNMGFVEENGGRVISANLTVGQSFVFPPGLIMWMHNLGCDEVRYLDTWQSSDPGISNIPTALFRLPPVTVAAALGIDLATAEALTSREYSKIAVGPTECLQRCNVSASLTGPNPVSLSTLTSSG